MKRLISALMMVHGFIHFLGFSTAFDIGKMARLSQDIPKGMGLIWLAAGLLFLYAGLLFHFGRNSWLFPGIAALATSQIMIFHYWQDARFGSLPNIILLIVALNSLGSRHFERSFWRDVAQKINSCPCPDNDTLTEGDLEHLPGMVQEYLRSCGCVGRPKVHNMRVVFEGRMRSKKMAWFPFRSEQYNFFDDPARLFFMKGTLFGIIVPGYHRYAKAKASMDIRLFGLIPVVRQAGKVMDQTETVTLFNDMCLLAPASLIDRRISWQVIDDRSVHAEFTNQEITVSAQIHFNEEGQLIDFLSRDRTSIDDMKQYPFSTPVSEYTETNGHRLIKKGEAIWHYAEGPFSYGEFILNDISYNVGL